MNIQRLAPMNRYDLSCIGNMDETPLWMDMPGDTTVERIGTRSVPVRSIGHEKARFTVVLTAMANGKKLKPFIVFNGIRVVTELAKVPAVVVALSRNGWMNTDLTKDWVCRVWGQLSFQKRLLVWDAYKRHLMSSVRQEVTRGTNTDLSIIPGGLTSALQPVDVSRNKPFKVAYRELNNEWMVSGDKNYTRGGNVRAPTSHLPAMGRQGMENGDGGRYTEVLQVLWNIRQDRRFRGCRHPLFKEQRRSRRCCA